MPCINKFFIGVSCPGCGMTRAWLYALRLDFKQAFYYHPLFFCVPLVLLWVLMRNKLPNWLYYTGLWLFLAAYIFVYVYRLLYSDHVVVNISPEEGIFYKIIKMLMQLPKN